MSLGDILNEDTATMAGMEECMSAAVVEINRANGVLTAAIAKTISESLKAIESKQIIISAVTEELI